MTSSLGPPTRCCRSAMRVDRGEHRLVRILPRYEGLVDWLLCDSSMHAASLLLEDECCPYRGHLRAFLACRWQLRTGYGHYVYGMIRQPEPSTTRTRATRGH